MAATEDKINLDIVKETINLWSIDRLEKSIEDCKKEFVQVTEILSNFLPNVEDPILFDIDDLLYPVKDYRRNKNNEYASESKKLCDITNISTYFTAYKYMLDEEDIFLDNTVLKFLKHVQCVLMVIFETIMSLFCSCNARKICIGLKMYKVVLEGTSGEYIQNEGVYTILSSLKDITEAREPNKKRISNFISKLAGKCCELMGDKYACPKKGLSDKKIILEGINITLFNEDIPDCYVDFFYKTFAKQTEEVDKRKYLEYILRGISSSRFGYSLQFAFSAIVKSLLYNITSCKSHSANNEMRIIDAKYGCDFKYLDNFDVTIDSNKVWSDEVNVEDETDYTFEKFFMYDEVMKNLHLLTIFYTACAECNTLCEDEFDEKDYMDVFSGQNYLMEYIAFFLKNPNLVIPWHIEKTMQMCPFFLFPLKDKELVVDLIKYLRGEDVPNMSEELCSKIEKMKSLYSLSNEFRQKDLSRYEKR